jgi:hypothetical protein
MRFSPVIFAALVLLSACTDSSADHQEEWRSVLRHKPAATGPGASPDHKQVYADSVRAFVARHPNHSRAREVWQRLQLEFADDLAGAGRYQDAIRFYRAVLAHHPESEHARRGLAAAADRLAVNKDKLATIEKGMSHRQVASALGRPIPGWTMEQKRGRTRYEAWYYRMRTGSVAAVYFRDGRVFAAEEASNLPLGRLGS